MRPLSAGLVYTLYRSDLEVLADNRILWFWKYVHHPK